MVSKLTQKTLKSGGWSFIEAISQRGVQFIVGVILARLLLPEFFGLIGMLSVFMAVMQALVDSGFGSALIQKQNITKKDICSVFYFNIIIGCAAAGGLCLLAPWVAAFYNQPILTPVLQVLSSALIFNSLGQLPYILLIKKLNFKTLTNVTLIASILSGCIGIGMAYWDYGIWSLVVQQIANTLFRTLLLWKFSDWCPAWLFSFHSLRSMFDFGSKLLASSLLNALFDNIYLVVIGKLYSPIELGYFTRADSLQKLPSSTLASVVCRVSFPVFASIQDDPERIKRGMKKALTLLALINFPIMIGLAVVAHPLVLVLLTEKWFPCIPYLQILCLIGLIYPFTLINLTILQSLGRSDLFLYIDIIKKILIILNIVITWRWGIMAMLIGQVIVSLISYYLNSYYSKKLLDYSLFEQFKDFYSYLIIALLMGGLVYTMNFLPFSNHLLLLSCQISTGALMYSTTCYFFRLSAFINLQNIILTRPKEYT